MAWPAPDTGIGEGFEGAPKASYEKYGTGTAYHSFARSIDSKLWPALMARSPLLALIPQDKTETPKFEWELSQSPARTWVLDAATETTIDGSGTNTNNAAVFTSMAGLEEGMLLRNASRATPIGTYGADELLQVTAISGGVATLKRDYAYQNSGTGSAAHATSDVFELVSVARESGSGPYTNLYKDVVSVANYVQTMDGFISVTGDQLASKREIAADSMATQMANVVRDLQNQLEKVALYGALNRGSGGNTETDAHTGSSSYVRTTKGLQNFVYASGGNVDYTTKQVTAPALDAAFASIIEGKTDETDKFIIACHPSQARVMSHFGEDLVRTTQESTVWGRSIKTFKSDLGIEADIIWTLNCSPSDVFIIDLNKIKLMEFRAWQTATVNFANDLVDAYRVRILGSYGAKVVDALSSHAALANLAWV